MKPMCYRRLNVLLLFLILVISANAAESITIDVSTMTPSGKYASTITSPFKGIALYTNGDQATKTVEFPDGNGVYDISVTGASSNSSAAGVSLYVDGVKIEAFSFSGTSATTKTSQKKIYLSSTAVEVKLLLETDNGSNDTYVKTIVFNQVKPIVDRPAPTLPAKGAYETGIYRNLVTEAGFTEAEVSARIQMLWNMYFAGDEETERVYYETGDGDAYILDANNDDVRSEGMSYGMMICVQLDKQEEFNKLWKFVKDRMIIKSGAAKGYISWQITKDGSNASSQCAPDGDEYLAMALMFAAGRWGCDNIDYWGEANNILNNTLSKDNLINSSVVNMFNETEQQVVFVPYASSAKHTDPSYHMPAFYTLWSKWANYNRSFWAALADKSREMYPKFANSDTGLMPDYANFDGTPAGSGHQEFRYDAWRCAMHMGTDYAWFAESANEVEQVNKLFSFFESEGITSYGSEYDLKGRKLTADHSPGLVACNATGALASTQKCVWDIIDDVQGASLTKGRYRYYDGMLYFLGYLHASGNFRIYKPAEVLDVAFDEQYKYKNGYLIIDDYENIPDGYEYYMRRTEGSTAQATVDVNPADASSHALHIKPGNYDEFYYLKYTLPKGKTLSGNYTQLEFDVYYNPDGDNNNQTLKVCIDNYSSPVYTESTGAKASQGVWKHVTVPVSGSYGNSFKLYIGVRTRAADFYIDNLKLLTIDGEGGDDDDPTGGDDDGDKDDDKDDDNPDTPETSNINNLIDADSYGFENGTKGSWGSWGNSSESTIVSPGYNDSKYCLKLTNPTAKDDYYHAQAGYKLSAALTNGNTFKLRFKAKAGNAGGSIQFCYQNSESYEGAGYNTINLTTDWKVYEYDVTISKDNMDRLIFSFGKVTGDFFLDEIEFGEEVTTRIETNYNNADNTLIYDLTGRRITNNTILRPGIYIINGKKVMMK